MNDKIPETAPPLDAYLASLAEHEAKQRKHHIAMQRESPHPPVRLRERVSPHEALVEVILAQRPGTTRSMAIAMASNPLVAGRWERHLEKLQRKDDAQAAAEAKRAAKAAKRAKWLAGMADSMPMTALTPE